MKKLMCLIAFGLFFPGSVIGQSATKPFFDPVQAKMENCQHVEKIKEILSCEQEGGTDCVPSTNYVIPPLSGIFFQTGATVACSFECVIGQELCDETLNPDKKKGFFYGKHYMEYQDMEKPSSYCEITNPEMTMEFIEEEFDEEGNRYKTKHTLKESGDQSCEQFVKYLMVCDENDENCKELEMFSEEWREHQKQAKLKKYKESCFIPTVEDCSHIDGKRAQCLQDVATVLEKAFCSSTNPQIHERLRELLESEERE